MNKCSECKMEVLEYDEQAIFSVFYCAVHDRIYDGLGNEIEFESLGVLINE